MGLTQPSCFQTAMILKAHPAEVKHQPDSGPISAAAVGIAMGSTKTTHSLMRPTNAHQQFLTTE